MKRILTVVFLMMVLTGCGKTPDWETVSDELTVSPLAQPKSIFVDVPGEAALPAMDSTAGRMYLGEDYEIYIQTLEAGDIDGTIEALSGYPAESLTVMETQEEGITRYEFVWACAGERGDRLGRGVVLDDGSHHYALTVLRDEETSQNSQITWSQVFESFRIGS